MAVERAPVVPALQKRATVVRTGRLVKRFGERQLFDGLSLTVQDGELVALIGTSGCGKTTLLRILGGLDQSFEGEVAVPDAKAFVYQEPRLLPWRRVWRNVALGLPRAQGRAAVLSMLREVGLGDRDDAWPNVLSGGEAARVSLARALVREPELLLLDEPFAALDALTRIRMHQLVMALWHRHRPAIVLVTHDIDEALMLVDRVLLMADGRIADEVTVDLPHPRRRGDPALAELRERLLLALGVEAEV